MIIVDTSVGAQQDLNGVFIFAYEDAVLGVYLYNNYLSTEVEQDDSRPLTGHSKTRVRM